MSEERGEHSLSVYTYFNPHLLLLLERIILKQTAVTKVCVLFCFFFLYFSYRIAEYLLVSNGSEIHFSKTMYFIVFIVLRQKYISKQAPELKKDEKKKDKEKRCYTLQYCSQSQDPLYTIYYLIKKICIQFS